MKNYGDRGGCYPSMPSAEADNTLWDLHNSSYDTKAEFNHSFKIIPSLKTWLKHPYLHRSIDVKFIFDSARLGLSSSANILQIADAALRVVILLFVLLLKRVKRVKRPPFLFPQPKQLNLVPRSSRLTVP